jgi:hypothetical protein
MMEKSGSRSIIPSQIIPGIRSLGILIIALTALGGYALAHPPSDVTVSYEESSGDLVVSITHLVDDPATHYVKHVTVRQGNSVVIEQSYTSQPAKSTFTYHYNLPQLKETSGEIRVDAECSILGSRSGTYKLPTAPALATPVGTGPPATRAPGSAFIAILAAGLVVTCLRH